MIVKTFFYLVFYLCFWYLVFVVFLFFWHSFKVRDSFSFICFLKSFLRISNSLSFCNQTWFSLPMHWFSKVSCKQEIFSADALRSFLSKESLFSNVSDTHSPELLPAAKFAITGEKGELRKSFIQLSFVILCFIWFYMHFPNLSKTCL